MGLNSGRGKARLAQALKQPSRIHDVFSKVEPTYSKGRATARDGAGGDGGHEEDLLMVAGHGTAAHVETVVRSYRQARAELAVEVLLVAGLLVAGGELHA